MNEKVTPILYVCSNTGCTYSAGSVSEHQADKPFGVVSAKPGTVAKCPVCGGACTTVEDGRHKFLRLNSMRIGVIREKMRLVGNTLKGAQYEPAAEDIEKVRTVLYAEFDRINAMLDQRAEKIVNGGISNKPKAVKARRNTFAL